MEPPRPADSLPEQLALVPLFADLQPEILRELAAVAVAHDYAPGEVVFMEGEAPPGLLILNSGYLKVVKSSRQGREHTLAFLAPPQPVNAVAAFSHRPSPATAIALEPTRIWLIPQEAIVRLLRAHPAFAERMIENMAVHMVHLVELVADLSLRSVMERLAKLLLDEAVDDTFVRPRWFTLTELAARLGTVPDVVQRALGRMDSDELVEVTRQEIRIIDRAGLMRLVGGA